MSGVTTRLFIITYVAADLGFHIALEENQPNVIASACAKTTMAANHTVQEEYSIFIPILTSNRTWK